MWQQKALLNWLVRREVILLSLKLVLQAGVQGPRVDQHLGTAPEGLTVWLTLGRQARLEIWAPLTAPLSPGVA